MLDKQAAKIPNPSEGSLNFTVRSIAPEFSTVLGAFFSASFAIRNDQLNFRYVESFTHLVTILDFISNHSQGAFFWPASIFSRCFYYFERLFGKFDFSGQCRGKDASQRRTLAVDHYLPFCAFAIFVISNQHALFFAVAKQPSMKASFQLSNTFSSNMGKKFYQTQSQTPWSLHRFSRRQYVDELEYRSGRSHQQAQVHKTHKMPFKTSWLSAG